MKNDNYFDTALIAISAPVTNNPDEREIAIRTKMIQIMQDYPIHREELESRKRQAMDKIIEDYKSRIQQAYL